MNKKILVTGGAGFLGKYILKNLLKRGVKKGNIFIPLFPRYDLRKMEDCRRAAKGRNLVIHLAGIVGGIGFNEEHPGIILFDNAMMSLNIIEAARKERIEKFVGIGSVCSYPKNAQAPFKEENLWSGYPEETNAPYGLAKKLMLVQSQAYREEFQMNAVHLLMINLYGPGDNFDLKSSHVIAALIRKAIEARKEGKKSIEVWGTGRATREFLYVEDAAEGIILATENYDKKEPVNLGSGKEISIKNLVKLICKLTDFKGKIIWDTSKPDGQPRRLLDVSKAEKEFGFKAKTELLKGLKNTIKWYEENREKLKI